MKKPDSSRRSAEILQRLGRLQEALERVDEAIELQESAVRRNPGVERIERSLHRHRRLREAIVDLED